MHFKVEVYGSQIIQVVMAKRRSSQHNDEPVVKATKNDQCYELPPNSNQLYAATKPKCLATDNFKQLLISYSGLAKNDLKYNHLIKLMKCISFKLNAKERGKMQAICSGSYCAFLAKKSHFFQRHRYFLGLAFQ